MTDKTPTQKDMFAALIDWAETKGFDAENHLGRTGFYADDEDDGPSSPSTAKPTPVKPDKPGA